MLLFPSSRSRKSKDDLHIKSRTYTSPPSCIAMQTTRELRIHRSEAEAMLSSGTLLQTLSQPLISMDSDPPFLDAYKTLFEETIQETSPRSRRSTKDGDVVIVKECELPLIDLAPLGAGEGEREECKAEIARASREWGFFQVVNHGISREILEKMRLHQERVFKQPFDRKTREDKYLNFSAGSYRWGTPSATCLGQLSWSEAFHIPMIDISCSGGVEGLSTTMQQFAATVSSLAQKLAQILAEKMGHDSTFFQENCSPSTCYLRLNRYPPCTISSEVLGLTQHTDSDFLTILHQDQVGGLQLVKDGRWIAVKPNPEALIINIGDLFQAWSNDVYKSVEHRVVSNSQVERFSTAYFVCPSYDTVIESCQQPSVYRKFSFREFREQVQADVKNLGFKIGLPRFRV